MGNEKLGGKIMRKKITSELINLTTKEKNTYQTNCIFVKNKIKYQENDTKNEINIKSNQIILIRENNDIKHLMFFKENETLESEYIIKNPNLNLTLNIKTKKLTIKKNSIYLKYEIIESKNIFEYKIELEDI